MRDGKAIFSEAFLCVVLLLSHGLVLLRRKRGEGELVATPLVRPDGRFRPYLPLDARGWATKRSARRRLLQAVCCCK